MDRTDPNPRTESARLHDDSDLIEDSTRAPAAAGTSGGNIARTVAARDEERQSTGNAGVTRVEKRDKVQPNLPKRSDHEGAQS